MASKTAKKVVAKKAPAKKAKPAPKETCRQKTGKARAQTHD